MAKKPRYGKDTEINTSNVYLSTIQVLARRHDAITVQSEIFFPLMEANATKNYTFKLDQLLGFIF